MKLASFWERKVPCWDLMDCPKYLRSNCPAYHSPELPCWENAYTQCEILTSIKRDCKYCKVFNLYGSLFDSSTL